VKPLKVLFDFYLNASIHVALAVVSLIYVTARFFSIPMDPHLAWFVFFGSIAGYNFIKYGVEADKYILVSGSYHRFIQFFSFIAIGLAAYHGNFLSLDVWIILGVLALLVGLYALPLVPRVRNLRNLGILKLLLIGFVWGGTTVILPYLSVKDALPWDLHVEALQRLVLILILMLPFEIRDLVFDAPALRTIPMRYGVRVTKGIGVFLSLLFVLLTFLKDNPGREELIAKEALLPILLLMIAFTRKNQSEYFASFWVEAVPIIWMAIVFGLYTWF
jgi:hypothetical protein